jgi:hypothetical protein
LKEESPGFFADGDTWLDMCVQVPVVKPPKLSDVLFDDEDQVSISSMFYAQLLPVQIPKA